MARWLKFPSVKSVFMYGAGDQGRINALILKHLGISIVRLYDDTPGMKSFLPKVPLYCGWDKANKVDYPFIIAIGNPHGKKRLDLHIQLKEHGLEAFSLVDRTARISATALVGKGLQAMPGAFVHGPGVKIGRQVILNTRCLVEHDCELGDGVEIGPNATLAGRVVVGDYSWICTGAVVRPRITIGKNCIIGAGAVVVRDIPDNTVAVGCPARPMEKRRHES